MEHGCTCTWIFFSLLAKALRRTHDISKYDCHILLLAKRAYGEILIRALIILKNNYLFKPLLGQKEVQLPPVLLL